MRVKDTTTLEQLITKVRNGTLQVDELPLSVRGKVKDVVDPEVDSEVEAEKNLAKARKKMAKGAKKSG